MHTHTRNKYLMSLGTLLSFNNEADQKWSGLLLNNARALECIVTLWRMSRPATMFVWKLPQSLLITPYWAIKSNNVNLAARREFKSRSVVISLYSGSFELLERRDVNNCLSSVLVSGAAADMSLVCICSSTVNTALPCLFCTFIFFQHLGKPHSASDYDITMMEEKQAASKVEGSLRTQTINSVNTEYTLYKCIHLGLRLLKTLLDEVFQNLLCWFIGFGQNKEAKLRSTAMRHGC